MTDLRSHQLDVSENSGTPKSSIFIRVFHYKPSILGVFPLFLETPNFHFTYQETVLRRLSSSASLKRLGTWDVLADGGCNHMGVSENGGTPKSSILIGFPIINHPFWGIPIFGNIHMIVAWHHSNSTVLKIGFIKWSWLSSWTWRTSQGSDTSAPVAIFFCQRQKPTHMRKSCNMKDALLKILDNWSFTLKLGRIL